MTKSEILFYYESRQNPNGDPDADNQPRLMHDNTIMVTDVRIKRTIRDYAKENKKYMLFVDFDENGVPVTADKRAKDIAKKVKDKTPDYIKILLEHTFDVPLFGGLVTIRKSEKEKGGSQKLTGPVQFGIGRSVNPVHIIQPAIIGRFVGDKTKGDHSTIGRFYSVEYALIKTSGAINPANLGEYLKDSGIKKNFTQYCDELPLILWDGTTQLVTRSKYPQRSVLFIQVDYKDTMYNDLADLVSESNVYKEEQVAGLVDDSFNFEKLVDTLNERKDQIEKIRIKCIDEIKKDVSDALASIKGIKIDRL
jgi:CRISPR-associated protein Csh2